MNTTTDSATPIQAPTASMPPGASDLKSLCEILLRRPQDLIPHLGGPGVAGKFTSLAVASFLAFGLVLGSFAKHEQLWAAPLKLAAGLVIAGLICFPSLYIFTTLAGARVNLSQIASALTGAMALAGLLLLGFAPAVWIFAESTDSYGFMGILGLGAWLIALAFAFRFLKAIVFSAGGTQRGPIFVWCLVFLLVSLQMTTSLRPILGRSNVFLTQEKRFFLQHWGMFVGKSLKQKPGVPGEVRGTPAEAPATEESRTDTDTKPGSN